MSKITNLIGTTWRLGDKSFDGLAADYGEFVITTEGTLSAYENGEFGISAPFYGLAILCGYFQWQSAPNSCSIYGSTETPDGAKLPYGVGTITDSLDYIFDITITGGDDVNNQLFIDFINTYGTLVSGGEPPTAEGVKSKLQSLITASNAKTGKSDANLTDAVKTLLEGYGQGEEVAEYEGSVVIEDAVKLISFTIDSTSYQAEEGMTWLEWVDSTYNTVGYYCNHENSDVYHPSQAKAIGLNSTWVKGKDYITSGAAYSLYSTGGSGN